MTISGFRLFFCIKREKDVGFFIPSALAHEFQPLFDALAKRQRQALLQRVAQAQLADPI
jgi:hypothetical protein